MQFLQKEWVKNQPTPTFDKEPVKSGSKNNPPQHSTKNIKFF